MLRQLSTVAALALVVSPAAHAQPIGTATAPAAAAAAISRAELEVLADEVVRLRAEVASLRADLAAVARTRLPAGDAAHGVLPISGVDEPAQGKPEWSSRVPVKIVGAIVSNIVGNTGEANWLENPNLVGAAPSTGAAGSFTSTLRQTRVGLEVGPVPVGGLTASGAVAADFSGGIPGFSTGTVMGLPRLVYALARLDGEKTALEVGQDDAMLAPRDPTSLAARSFPLFFRSGNLYLHVPQVRVERRFGRGVTLKAGIVAPVAGDGSAGYVFGAEAGTGERSRRPAAEAHVGYVRGDTSSAGEFALGVSGHVGWRRVDGALDEGNAVAIDFTIRRGRFGAAGEFFRSDALAAFGAGVAQPRPAEGGWVEGRLAVSGRASINAGMALDRLRGFQFVPLRRENRGAFANVIFTLSPEIATSVEYRWLDTLVGSTPAGRRNHHLNATFVLRF
jgi:hypothetical protein